tara:strand:- start:9450 stop:9653 length:204 start_codon:yes stop_codon:yes gene_type:complete
MIDEPYIEPEPISLLDRFVFEFMINHTHLDWDTIKQILNATFIDVEVYKISDSMSRAFRYIFGNDIF